MALREPQSPLRDLALYTMGLRRSLVYSCIKAIRPLSWLRPCSGPWTDLICFGHSLKDPAKTCLRQSPVGERGFAELQVSRWQFPAHHWITVEINTEVLQKKMSWTATIYTSNSTPEYISKGNEKRIPKRYMHSHVNWPLFTTPKVEKQLSLSGWMDKDYVKKM